MLTFPKKKKKTKMLKKKLIFWARQGLTLVLRILIRMRNKDYVLL